CLGPCASGTNEAEVSTSQGAEPMKERELRDLIADVKTGQMSRRSFVQRMIAVGLTAPMAGMMLAQSGVPMQAAEIPYKPTKAGGGGLLKILYWQGGDLPHTPFCVR